MIQRFNNFDSEYPDIFGDNLIRRMDISVSEHIDDPSKRNIRLGLGGMYPNNTHYKGMIEYLTIGLVNLGIPNPLKSVHMCNKYGYHTGSRFGNFPYKVIPKVGSNFGFSEEIGISDQYWKYLQRNGSFGSLVDIKSLLKDTENKIKSEKIGCIKYGDLKSFLNSKKDKVVCLWTDGLSKIVPLNNLK